MPLQLTPLPAHLRRNNLERRLPRSGRCRDRTGEVIDGCEILGFVGITKPGFATWLYRCRCGRLSIITSNHLQARSPGCGCRARKHGLTRTPIFALWQRMIASCYDPQHPSYHLYGAKGVTVCRRWRQSTGSFAEDVGPRPSSQHQLTLLAKRAGYRPGNVRWMTAEERLVRRGEITVIEHRGLRLTIRQWAQRTGLSRQLINQRVAKCRAAGADLAQAVATPKGERMSCMAPRRLATPAAPRSS